MILLFDQGKKCGFSALFFGFLAHWSNIIMFKGSFASDSKKTRLEFFLTLCWPICQFLQIIWKYFLWLLSTKLKKTIDLAWLLIGKYGSLTHHLYTNIIIFLHNIEKSKAKTHCFLIHSRLKKFAFYTDIFTWKNWFDYLFFSSLEFPFLFKQTFHVKISV